MELSVNDYFEVLGGFSCVLYTKKLLLGNILREYRVKKLLEEMRYSPTNWIAQDWNN